MECTYFIIANNYLCKFENTKTSIKNNAIEFNDNNIEAINGKIILRYR